MMVMGGGHMGLPVMITGQTQVGVYTDFQIWICVNPIWPMLALQLSIITVVIPTDIYCLIKDVVTGDCWFIACGGTCGDMGSIDHVCARLNA